MAKVIEGLYYSESHEYVRVEGEFGYIGITDYAQHELGNVVYVDMPEVDDEVEAGEEFGAVESVKAASDLISPVSGTVISNVWIGDHYLLIVRTAAEEDYVCQTEYNYAEGDVVSVNIKKEDIKLKLKGALESYEEK